jgi:hypothetical protein
MVIAASIFAPALTGIALALVPAQSPSAAPVDFDPLSAAAAAAPGSFAGVVHAGAGSMLPSESGLPVGMVALPAAAPVGESGHEGNALAEALRWAVAFAGIAAVGALARPRH